MFGIARRGHYIDSQTAGEYIPQMPFKTRNLDEALHIYFIAIVPYHAKPYRLALEAAKSETITVARGTNGINVGNSKNSLPQCPGRD
jgi:hypothetical protein